MTAPYSRCCLGDAREVYGRGGRKTIFSSYCERQLPTKWKTDDRPVQPMPVLVLKQSRLKKEEPTLADLCVYLAGTAFPMERLFRDPIAPQCVNVNYGECAIALLGNCNAQRLALVVNEIVRLKERLP